MHENQIKHLSKETLMPSLSLQNNFKNRIKKNN